MPFFDAINHGHYVSRLYIFYQVFFSSQVKGSVVITNKHVSWPAQYTVMSYILETSSKRPNEFSLTGRKPNEILQFKWKRLMVLKFKSKLNLKFMPKGSKKIRIMEMSKGKDTLWNFSFRAFHEIQT